jgi:hypothetical protein
MSQKGERRHIVVSAQNYERLQNMSTKMTDTFDLIITRLLEKPQSLQVPRPRETEAIDAPGDEPRHR